MKRKAEAVWQGGLKDGKGQLGTDSGVLAGTPYYFGTRFENGSGSNPEELIAAAHAGCFSMALSGQLGAAGLTPERIRTVASVSLEKKARVSPSPRCSSTWWRACPAPATRPSSRPRTRQRTAARYRNCCRPASA